MSSSRPKKPLRSFKPRVEELESRVTPAVAYALSGTSLLSFDTANPTTTTSTTIVGVDANETLVGIDIRPQNGQLYGLGVDAGADSATLYAISVRTGIATIVNNAGMATPTVGTIAFTTDGVTLVDLPNPATVGYGLDFNPAADRLRIVAGSLNFRVNPNTGLGVDGDNGGAAMSVTGLNPDGAINTGTTTVDATAYTNNVANNGNITTQYTLDASTDSLFIQNPPNAGTQTVVGAIGAVGVDFNSVNGFDIPVGVNDDVSGTGVAAGSAFAVLNVGGTTALYTINLVTGVATMVGNVGNGTTAVQGFTVSNDYGGFPAIALSADGLSLNRFNTATPGTVTNVLITAGLLAGDMLVGIDFRPQTGQLYAIGINSTADTGTVYLVTPQSVNAMAVDTASLAVVGTFAFVDSTGATLPLPDPTTTGYGIDFNPTVDRIRITTSSGLNFRVRPDTGVGVDGDTTSVGTINPDSNINGLPMGSTGVSSTAYTNGFGQPLMGGTTTQYTLDAGSNSLFIQTLPNSGTQTAILPVMLNGMPLDFTDVTGFDIPAGVRVTASNTPQTAAQGGRGFATLTVGTTTQLYSINLATGVATLVGNLGAGATGSAGLTLADAPAGTITFSSPTFVVTENGGTVTISATRTGGTNGSVSVTVNVVPGGTAASTDFSGTPVTLTFADGATTATGTINIIDNTSPASGNRTINLALANPTNGAVLGLAASTTATVTIFENEGAPAIGSGVAYALSGNSLIAFDPLNPSAANAPRAITGLTAGDTLVGIDFRPQNGLLYGLGYNGTAGTAQLYVIAPQSGIATAVGAIITATTFVDAATNPVRIGADANTTFGFDFNPVPDRIRVVTNNGQDFRINPNTGAVVDGDLGGAAMSVGGTNMDAPISGGTTTVDGAAYTNNVPNTATTTLYTLDSATNSFFIQNPPNSGNQTAGRVVTLNGAPLDFTAVGGFDIQPGVISSGANLPGIGSALAILTVGGTPRLYSIDLGSGAATLLGTVGAGTPVQGLAFQGNAVVNGTPAIGLNAAGTALIRFNTATPTTSTNVNIGAGVTAGETLVGIDFRPATGQLYALGINATANSGSLYLIDPQSGAVTLVGTASQIAFVDASGNPVDLPDATAGYGLDFNPAADRLRVTTGTGLNFRINPITGAPIDGNNTGMAPPVGPINPDGPIAGLPPGSVGVTATAYVNSFGQPATGGITTQYTLDATSNSLFIQNPPNNGTQTGQVLITTDGTSMLDFESINGFDIPGNVATTASGTAVPSGTGIATLNVGGVSQLYSINLVTGVATLLGAAPVGLSGLTVATTPAGSVSFAAGSFTVNENVGTASVTLTRTGGTSGEVTVVVNLANGTAGGGDFTGTPVTVTFADGATTATAMIPITDDLLDEETETILLSLTTATGGVIGAQNGATLSIVDDDLPVTPPNPQLAVVGSGTGQPSTVRVFNPDGSTRFTLNPYGTFTGGVDTASGDVTGDGVADIITGARAGGGPHVKVFDGNTGAELASFFAFASNFAGGVSVATLDFNNDGRQDIVVAAGAGGGPHVKIIDGTQLGNIGPDSVISESALFASFFAYASNFTGGVSIDTGDVTGDGIDDLITGAQGGTAHVKVFQGGGNALPEVRSFFAFPTTQLGGVNVAAANGSIFAAPAGTSSDSTVRVYGQNDDVNFTSFNPYPGFSGGVRIASNDVGQIVTGAGPGGGPHIKVFDPVTFAELNSFFAFDVTFTGGVFVG